MEASKSIATPALEMAHVLFMDIVAYSRLPMDSQHQMLCELQEAVRNTSEFVRAQADDELIRLPTGDGMALVFFGNPEAPVRCAIELTKILRNHPPATELRIGIHTGPVYRVADINANRNVAGGGINIAQRVMDCGDAGHILVSAAEAEVLSQVSSWCAMLHDLGEVEVKHEVRIHLYNLYTEEAGSPEVPKKIGAQRAASSLIASNAKKRKLSPPMITGIAALALASLSGWLFYTHKAHALNSTDTIVVGGFTNKTGDAVFDDTLRQGLTVQLEQSPFLSLISDERIQQTLRFMEKQPDARLTPQIARDICQRTESKAYIAGSLASLGNQYVLGLKAVNCQTGGALAEDQLTADSKEHVLSALDQAAAKLRQKLGESLSTIERFYTPLWEATTNSLEALQAYSVGLKEMGAGDYHASVPFFQKAIRLDPNFAMAYSALGTSYSVLGELNVAAEHSKKAYELRERVSEGEKLMLEASFYSDVSFDLEKARQAYEFWAETYPRDFAPRNNLGSLYSVLGQHDRALAGFREAFPISPARGLSYANLVYAYLNLNRLEEARATAEEAQAKKLDSSDLRFFIYALAFLQNDATGMAQEVSWAAGKPGVEDVLLALDADTAAYSGGLGKARELSRRAVASAERAGEKETAAGYQAEAALREALFGNAAAARQGAAGALGLSTGLDVQGGAALALAIAGDNAQSQKQAEDLSKRFPESTVVQFNYLPTIRAQLALNRHDGSKAIEALQAATPYELGIVLFSLYPINVRGEVYLAAHQGNLAAAEFQKILDHCGVVRNEPIGALAHLGLARAYALQGNSAKARTKYQDFLNLWKNADPEIPILRQAKAEYAKLQ
jgi:class 3 adenylate cyclase/tetratricopeptide (TPR) repeat protein